MSTKTYANLQYTTSVSLYSKITYNDFHRLNINFYKYFTVEAVSSVYLNTHCSLIHLDHMCTFICE